MSGLLFLVFWFCLGPLLISNIIKDDNGTKWVEIKIDAGAHNPFDYLRVIVGGPLVWMILLSDWGKQ